MSEHPEKVRARRPVPGRLFPCPGYREKSSDHRRRAPTPRARKPLRRHGRSHHIRTRSSLHSSSRQRENFGSNQPHARDLLGCNSPGSCSSSRTRRLRPASARLGWPGERYELHGDPGSTSRPHPFRNRLPGIERSPGRVARWCIPGRGARKSAGTSACHRGAPRWLSLIHI